MNPLGKIFLLICIFAIVASATANPKRLQRSSDTCGVLKSLTGLIVRGQSFVRGDFPWIVALMHSHVNPARFFCAGTLISSTFVITAAHCINPRDTYEDLLPRDVSALFGAHDLGDSYEAGSYSLSPKKIIIHGNWNQWASQHDGDLSLLEFEDGSIHFNTFVQPICLWSTENEPTVSEGIVVEWSRSEDRTTVYKNIPKLVEVLIHTSEQCFVSNHTFCAGLGNGSNMVHGESGGGLFIYINYVFYLKGIVSSTPSEDAGFDTSKIAIYTNVPEYRDWIEKKTGGIPYHSRRMLMNEAMKN